MRARPGKIVVVRHGATAWSESGRHTGRTNIGLTPLGRVQAAELRDGFALLESVRVYTSPLDRALQTCVLAGFGDGAELLDELMEWDYGDYEGLTTAEIRATRPTWDLFADGCPGGEDVIDVSRRADAALQQIGAQAFGPDTVVVFAHGHLLRVFVARHLGLDAKAGAHFVLPPARMGVLSFEREVPVLAGWNGRALSHVW